MRVALTDVADDRAQLGAAAKAAAGRGRHQEQRPGRQRGRHPGGDAGRAPPARRPRRRHARSRTAGPVPSGQGTVARRAPVRDTWATVTIQRRRDGTPPRRAAAPTGGATGRDERHEDPEHGRRRDRRRHQQVGRDRHEADVAGQHRDDRRARDLGSGRDGERIGHDRRRCRASRWRHGGASTSSPAVASTDSAKPYDRPSPGSLRRRTTTAAHSAGSPAARPPRPRATTATTPQTVARSTDGSGRARTRKPSTAASPAAGTALARSPPHRAASSAAARTIATFAPLTATRCVRPDVRKSATTSDGMPSRVTDHKPREQPPLRDRERCHGARSPARRCPATRCSLLGGPTASGGPRATSRAAAESPGRAGASRTSARRRWLGSSADQPSALARTTTGSRVVQRWPRASTCSRRPGTMTCATAGPNRWGVGATAADHR